MSYAIDLLCGLDPFVEGAEEVRLVSALPVGVDKRALQMDSKNLSAFIRAPFPRLDSGDLLQKKGRKEEVNKQTKEGE